MTPEQIALVQSSWEKVVPIKEDAARLFYGRLFEMDPSLRSYFKEDIEEQGRKLMTIITTVVRGLKNLDVLEETVWQLGRRHRAYNIQEPHYGTVAQALLWTLEQGLGAAFTADVKAAWVEAYTVLSGVMLAGAKSPEASFAVYKASH